MKDEIEVAQDEILSFRLRKISQVLLSIIAPDTARGLVRKEVIGQ